MSSRTRALWGGGVAAVVLLASAQSAAQDVGGDTGAPAPGNPANARAGTTTLGQGSTSTTTTYVPPYGYYPAEGTNIDGHLPSSSQSKSDINQNDGFDLPGPESGGITVHGSEDAPAFQRPEAGGGPRLYTVEKGDTLWDICAGQFGNPWEWPRVWSYNPQIQNPHWIYPGDQLRLSVVERAITKRLAGESLVLGMGDGQPLRRALVPQKTVFLRNLGYIDDPTKDVWGELVGAQRERLILAEGSIVYMILRPGVKVKKGQLLTVFRPLRSVRSVEGARMPDGELVAFRGAVEITGFDEKTRVARGKLIESLGEVERGAKVGPIRRRFEVVPPKPSKVDLWARVLTSMYPHEVLGQNQVVFIDRGANDGLKKGNRLFVVRRGDSWRNTLETTTAMARTRARLEADDASVELTPIHGDQEDFPEETIGEIRIISLRATTALALVTESAIEIAPGDRVVARKGH